jgi:penicillin amidase
VPTTIDEWGIPRVSGEDVLEVAHEQGLAVAQDRTWQITLDHWRVLGTTAAVLGPSGVSWDVFSRRALVEETARAAYARLDLDTRAFVDAYVDGVNLGLSRIGPVSELDRLDARPTPWEPFVPLGIFLVNHILFGTFPAKLWREHLVSTVGPSIAALFHYEGLWSAGSNAWVVGGERTASGLPLLAGDPHRNYQAPNCYQQVQLVCPDFDVTGMTFPGVPGVQHFAHAGSVAWGITNASADYQDVFVEDLRRTGAGVQARGPAGWYDVPSRIATVEVRSAPAVTAEVIETANGPVVIGGPGEAAYSLRTPSFALSDLGFSALVPLLRARSTGDVEAAFARWVEPVNNLLVADDTGAVVQRVVGRVPDRAEANRWLPVDGSSPQAAWTGWVDLPHSEVAPEGQLATANQRMDGFDRIGTEFSRSARADRIDALLDGRTGLTSADFAAIHLDTQRPPSVLLDLVGSAEGLSDAAIGLQAELIGWDGRMEADSAAAGAFLAVRDAVVAQFMELESLAGLGSGSPYGDLYAAWFVLSGRVLMGLDELLSAGELLKADTQALVADAMEVVSTSSTTGDGSTTYGERHRFGPWHGLTGRSEDPAIEVPLGGDYDCVLAAGALPGVVHAHRGPVARYVWDLADRSAGGWVVPLGADGDLVSVHGSDQLGLYADGRLVPLPPVSRARPPGD